MQRLIVGMSREAIGKPPLKRYPSLFKRGVTNIEPDITGERDSALVRRFKAIGNPRPLTITPGEIKKGLTLKQKQARWDEKLKSSVSWLRDHGYTQEQAATKYVQWARDDAKDKGQRPTTRSRTSRRQRMMRFRNNWSVGSRK